MTLDQLSAMTLDDIAEGELSAAETAILETNKDAILASGTGSDAIYGAFGVRGEGIGVSPGGKPLMIC